MLACVGETLPYEEVVKLQKISGVLYGTRYRNAEMAYKLAGIQQNRSRIVAVGSSRMLQIRKEHFLGPGGFYNTGVAASVLEDFDGMRIFFEELARNSVKPEIVVLGVDPWSLNPRYIGNLARASTGYRARMWMKRKLPILRYLSDTLKQVRRSVSTRYSAYRKLIRERDYWFGFVFKPSEFAGIGLTAKFLSSGFRPDGSYKYPDTTVPKLSVVEMVERLSRDAYQFPPARTIDAGALIQFRGVLRYAAEHGIAVVVILPPLEPDFLRAIDSLESHRQYLPKFVEAIRAVSEAEGVAFHDFLSFKVDGDEFIDNLHPGERTMGEIVRRIGL